MPESKSDKLYKWTLLGLLAFTYFLMHASRQVFNASLPQIQGDLASHGATDAQLGLSRTFFLFAYGCMVPFAGIFRYISRRIYYNKYNGAKIHIFCRERTGGRFF